MAIKKAMGFQTDDGRIWPTLNEAAGHIYGKRLKEVLKPSGGSGVFGVNAILENSREVEEILAEYNLELCNIEQRGNDD